MTDGHALARLGHDDVVLRRVVTEREALFGTQATGFLGGVPQPGDRVVISRIPGNGLVAGPLSEGPTG